MVFNTGAALLDAIVLAVVSKEADGTYGYRITQDVRGAIDISESTLYPVLRRLQKEACLEVYDLAIDGRNRRYYRITEKGRVQLHPALLPDYGERTGAAAAVQGRVGRVFRPDFQDPGGG